MFLVFHKKKGRHGEGGGLDVFFLAEEADMLQIDRHGDGETFAVELPEGTRILSVGKTVKPLRVLTTVDGDHGPHLAPVTD